MSELYTELKWCQIIILGEYKLNNLGPFNGFAKTLVRAHMKDRSITYKELSSKLSQIGIEYEPILLKNCICRGNFGADLYFAIINALREDIHDGHTHEIITYI